MDPIKRSSKLYLIRPIQAKGLCFRMLRISVHRQYAHVVSSFSVVSPVTCCETNRNIEIVFPILTRSQLTPKEHISWYKEIHVSCFNDETIWFICALWNNCTRYNFHLTSYDTNVPLLSATCSSFFYMFSYNRTSLCNKSICYQFWDNVPVVVVIAVCANTRESMLVAVVLARLLRVCTTQCSSLPIFCSNHIVSSLSS
jgi:hypothetical protein